MIPMKNQRLIIGKSRGDGFVEFVGIPCRIYVGICKILDNFGCKHSRAGFLLSLHF